MFVCNTKYCWLDGRQRAGRPGCAGGLGGKAGDGGGGLRRHPGSRPDTRSVADAGPKTINASTSVYTSDSQTGANVKRSASKGIQ